jgi:hypothetical protein
MAFNLPSAQYSMTTSSQDAKRGTFRTAPALGRKQGGNFPINANAAQMSNNSGERGVYFGLDAQDSTSATDGTASGRVVLSSFQFNAPNRIQVNTLSSRGVVFRIASGSGDSPTDFREWSIAGNDTPQASAQAGAVTMCVSLDADGFDTSGGNYDPTAATAWGFGTNKTSLVGNSSSLAFFQRVFLFDSDKGSANLPTFTGASNFTDAVTVVQGTDYTNKIGSWTTQSGTAIFLPCPFSIGDGSTATVFNDNGASIISPSNNSANQENFRITDSAMKVHLDMRDNAADSAILSGNYTWGTAAAWTFNESNASTCLLSGNFTGMGKFRIGSSVTAPGTFDLDGTQKVESYGANIDSITVKGQLRIRGDGVTTFTGINVELLAFDVAGTYTLTNSIVNQVTNTSGGSVIIVNDGSTITTNTGPNITIVSPPKTLTVQVSQTGADVVILEGGTNTVLASVDAQAGNDFVFTYTGAQVVDIGVIKQGFGIKYTYGYNLTGENQALPVALQVDRAYQ